MRAVIKGSAFLGVAFVVFSVGCADPHMNTTSSLPETSQSQSGTQSSSDQPNGFVSPEIDSSIDAQGTTAGNASQETIDGVPGTPLQQILDAQLKQPNATLSVKDDELTVLPSDLQAGLHLDKIRAALFQQINKERAAAKVNPVAYDAIGEAAAGIHVLEQLDAKNYLTHYSTDGDLPYMRYSRAGGYDSNSENVAFWSGGADGPTEIDQSDPCTKDAGTLVPAPTAANIDQITLFAALAQECSMVNEKPPHDGHRKTILDPNATLVGVSVGVGIWQDAGPDHRVGPRIHVYVDEEFQTRGLTAVEPIPLVIQNSQTQSVDFAAQVDAAYTFVDVQYYFEKLVKKSVEQIQGLHSYSLPENFEMLLPQLPLGGSYSFGPKQALGSAEPSPSPAAKIAASPKYLANVIVKSDKFLAPLPLDQGPGVYTMLVIAKKKSDNTYVGIGEHSIYVTP